MTDKLAPPDDLRGTDGYHWLHYTIGTAFVARWRASAGGGWWAHPMTGYPAAHTDAQYMAPVMEPQDVDALRTEIGRLRGIIRVNALRAGLTHDDVDAVIGGEA